MDFPESTEYLFSLGNEVSAMKLGLENIRTLLRELGDPQNNYVKVQVAGTNGKGSVCAFLDSITNSAGIRTGTFTSPHLVSVTERIRINGSDISEDDFARHATGVRLSAESLLENDEVDYRPTFFEQITAIALVAFEEAKVDIAILETGLGGRLDATTAANAEIAAITRIDLDHQEYLGETIEEIAAEKAAIIHEGSIAVVGEQLPEVMKVIQQRCDEFGVVPLTEFESGQWAIGSQNRSVVAFFRIARAIYSHASLGLPGQHQLENAGIAVLVAEVLRYDFGLAVDENNILNGLASARHPGRLEYYGRYLFDGAHNLGGAKALREYLREFESRPITLVFAAMKGKSVADMLLILAPHLDRIIVTETSNSRSMSCEDILKQLPSDVPKENTTATKSVVEAIKFANEITPNEGLILITGSLYLVGEAKKILNN